MPTRSQEHLLRTGRYSSSGVAPQVNITLTTLSPTTAAASTMQTITVNGGTFVGGETIVFAGTSYPSTRVSGTQITTAAAINVGLAGAKTVFVKRGLATSNSLTFTVT